MYSKLTTLMVLALLLLFALAYADARPSPGLTATDSASLKTQHGGHADVVVETEQNAATEAEEESCEGPGQDECLMRRTLADRTDFIYTQSNSP